jgi:hypothetical protein
MLLSSARFPPTYLSLKTQQRLDNSGFANVGFQVFTVFYLYPLLLTVLFGFVYHWLLFRWWGVIQISWGQRRNKDQFFSLQITTVVSLCNTFYIL